MSGLTNQTPRVHSLRAPAAPAPTNPPVSNIHQCDLCSKSFQTAAALASHRQSKNKKHLQHKCTICQKSFQTADGLVAHQRSKHIVCSTCNQAFSTSAQLEGHRLDAHPRQDPGPSVVNTVKAPPTPPKVDLPATEQTGSGPSCSQCNQRFPSLPDLNRHIGLSHEYTCSVCGERFPSFTEYNQHVGAKHKTKSNASLAAAHGSPLALPVVLPTSLSCSQCNQRFPSWADLNRHVGLSHGYKCSVCGERFPSFTECNQHFGAKHKTQSNASLAAAHGSPLALPVVRPTSPQSNHSRMPSPKQDTRIVCDPCNKTFKSNEALQAHTAAKHPSGPNCGVCQHKATSATALEAHVNEVHCCTVCRDGIVRDVKTLDDHMVEHTHPFRCEICETIYRSEEERSVHFTSSDRHPLCTECQTGFVDAAALQSHVSSNHPSPRIPSPRKELKCPQCPELFTTHVALEAHLAEVHPIFECPICRESYSTQSALTDHISTAHSCPDCGKGVYVDAKSLEEHQEEHRDPYRCVPCGTRYAEEGLLFQHYKESSNDVHPVCMRCDLGFENDNTYNIHVVEVHRPTPCEACEGLIIDEIDLPLHYLSSRRHPRCETCQMGFKDKFDFAEHGALQHPESHCHLCRWQFDSCNALHSHIRHFANHPKCVNCDLRFADAKTYQHHLFAVHCPKDDNTTTVPTTPVDEGHQLSLPPLTDQYNRVTENQAERSSEAYNPLPASSISLLPNASGYSSPASQNVDSENSTQPDAQSCSSTLIIDQPSPKDSDLRQFVPPSLNVDTGKYTDSYQEFNHSPLSMVPAAGTPLLSSAQPTPSVDYLRPFSPRPGGPSAFRAAPVINGVIKGSVQSSDDDGSDSSFARSPPLISPGVKLPSPASGSPTSSGWTSDSGSVTKLSLNSCVSSHPKIFLGTDKSVSVLQASDAGSSTRCVPPSASPVSLESPGFSTCAVTQTPEYLREARAYLPLTHPTPRVSSPSVPHSPTNSSPILSSIGLAVGDSGRRREVRFDDSIMSEPVWDNESTSSDASLDIPVTYRRSNGIHTRKHGTDWFQFHFQA
ncbi:hypothetical protein PISMIDRAFT_175074 [Pisolithus microcarpus 441]|uniref:C2H2-type domain-containing protein n=1 Tax=Pisolithus microcarpus 441 TaxID=765257 RepID=A0A0C9ZFN7_9AGAM|nr:hypothetical protein PISMIDRAFT_175074 [Pisolithus microcarpus 441]